MKITKVKQHFIGLSDAEYSNMLNDYAAATSYFDRRNIIESVPLETNPKWLAARRGHITASNAKAYLTNGRTKEGGMGETSKSVVKKYVAELYGWEEPEVSWNEKSTIKRGLLFEKRARELFKKETGIEINTKIGFISENIDGINFGYSPDGYTEKDGKIDCLFEIKAYELQGFMNALDEFAKPEMYYQMQMAMLIADCPRCYAIWYCPELDKVAYIKYTRGLQPLAELQKRNVEALEYIGKLKQLFDYTDLTDKVKQQQ